MAVGFRSITYKDYYSLPDAMLTDFRFLIYSTNGTFLIIPFVATVNIVESLESQI